MKALKRQLYILLVLCALALLFFVLLFVSDRRGNASAAATGEIVFSCDASFLNSIQIETEGRLVFILRQSGTDVNWVFEDSGEAVNETMLAQMLDEIEEVKSDTVIEEVTDFAPYGLDAPSMRISLAFGGMSQLLEIGDYSANAHRYYARANGENRVFLISTAVKTAFDVTEAEMMIYD